MKREILRAGAISGLEPFQTLPRRARRSLRKIFPASGNLYSGAWSEMHRDACKPFALEHDPKE
ncbi:MAG TPA: hypothetical protein VF267_01000 [Gammaproteobacteria bacterium]